MDYTSKVNDSRFIKACKLAKEAQNLLSSMGLNQSEIKYWIHAWISGAGDGAE